MSYQLVKDLQKKATTVVHAAHAQRLAAPAVCAASVHLKAAFAASHKAYGSRRL